MEKLGKRKLFNYLRSKIMNWKRYKNYVKQVLFYNKRINHITDE